MEDSAKRRQRLQAMRLEAEATSISSESINSSVPPSIPLPQLSNPLLDPPLASESSPPARRFDYYTDPMSAYSGAKRKSGPGAYCSPTPPLSRPNGPRTFHQSHATQSQGSTSNQMLPPFSPDTSWRSPVQYSAPYTGFQGTPFGSSIDRYHSTPLSGGFSPHHGRGVCHVSTPAMRGSPLSNSGRGKGGRFSGHRSPRWTGGQGCSSYRTGSGLQEIDHYYLKSMVKDPWRKLKPIVRDITRLMNRSLESKAKVAESRTNYSFSKPGCLAQFLADEAAANEM